MSTILQLAPQNVWKHFYSLTQICLLYTSDAADE